jgi:DNA-binding CsgD family transcriptional regulator
MVSAQNLGGQTAAEASSKSRFQSPTPFLLISIATLFFFFLYGTTLKVFPFQEFLKNRFSLHSIAINICVLAASFFTVARIDITIRFVYPASAVLFVVLQLSSDLSQSAGFNIALNGIGVILSLVVINSLLFFIYTSKMQERGFYPFLIIYSILLATVLAGATLVAHLASQLPMPQYLTAAIAIVLVVLYILPQRDLFRKAAWRNPVVRYNFRSGAASRDRVFAEYGFSKRESEVASLMVQGLTRPAIAEKLVVSLDTVNTHARRIYRKLGVSNYAEFFALVGGTSTANTGGL